MFFKIGAFLKNANDTGKHLCWSLFLIKITGLRPATLFNIFFYHPSLMVLYAMPKFTPYKNWNPRQGNWEFRSVKRSRKRKIIKDRTWIKQLEWNQNPSDDQGKKTGVRCKKTQNLRFYIVSSYPDRQIKQIT